LGVRRVTGLELIRRRKASFEGLVAERGGFSSSFKVFDSQILTNYYVYWVKHR
jgi:hypothetical protein